MSAMKVIKENDSGLYVRVPKLNTLLQIITILSCLGTMVYWWHKTESRIGMLEQNAVILSESAKLSSTAIQQLQIAVTKLTVIVDALDVKHEPVRNP